MNVQELQTALRRQPFTPLRMFISDGAVYDVRHPELCVLGRRSVFIGIAESESEELIYDRYAIVDLPHITRLEPLDVSASQGDSERNA